MVFVINMGSDALSARPLEFAQHGCDRNNCDHAFLWYDHGATPFRDEIYSSDVSYRTSSYPASLVDPDGAYLMLEPLSFLLNTT